MRVVAEVDARRRQRHMRFHTATHLLCALVPHPVDGCSITADYARLDFHMTEPLDKAALNEGLARLVAEAHAVRHRWISDAELDAQPQLVRSMSVQPPRGSGRVRLLEIEGVDLQPCGGTHVANTRDIGPVVVTKIEKKSACRSRRRRPRVLGLPGAGSYRRTMEGRSLRSRRAGRTRRAASPAGSAPVQRRQRQARVNASQAFACSGSFSRLCAE